MTSMRMFMSVALLGLGACNLITASKAKLGGSDAASPAAPITADAKDSPAVKNKLDELSRLEEQAKAQRWTDYARGSTRLHSYFLFENGLDGEAKRERIMQRLDALDAAAYATFPRLRALVGDGTRLLDGGVAKPAIEALVVVLNTCDGTADIRTREALAEKVTAYETALGRVKKADANAFRYYGETNSRFGSEDVPNALLVCEANLASAASQFAEEYVAEAVPATQVEIGCGSATFLADGIRTGPNQFAAFTRTEGGAYYPEKVSCSKLPKRSKYAPAFAGAVADYAKYIEIPASDLVVVLDGQPYVEESDSDGYLHRFQKLVAYSKKFRFAKNPCGAEKLFCEAGGSKGAAAYNRLEHALERAEVHAGTNASLCRAHLKDAKAQADWFAEFYAESKQRREWVSGSTYKTKKGAKLEEAAFIASFKDKGRLADDRMLGTYCDTAAKTKAARR